MKPDSLAELAARINNRNCNHLGARGQVAVITVLATHVEGRGYHVAASGNVTLPSMIAMLEMALKDLRDGEGEIVQVDD